MMPQMPPMFQDVYNPQDDPVAVNSVVPLKFSAIPKEMRDSIGGYDFVIDCSDGKVKCHKAILCLQSHAGLRAIEDGERLDKLEVSCTTAEMEDALDLIYGLSSRVQLGKNENTVTNINYALFQVMDGLDIKELTHHSFYRSHFHDLDIKDEILESNRSPKCNLYTVSTVIKWIVDHDGMEPKKLIEPLMAEMCRIAVTFEREPKIITALENMMMKLTIPTLKILFEQHNIYMQWANLDDEWRIDFLLKFMNDANMDEIRNVLLPRTSMIEHFADAEQTAATFGVPSTPSAILEFQLNAGYFYDRYNSYKLVPHDSDEPTTFLRLRSIPKSPDRNPFNIELDVSYIPLLETLGVLAEKKVSPFGAPPAGCAIQ